MKDVLRIAIVDPADDTREPLRNLLLGVDSVWLEAECARYEFFLDVVAQASPDIGIVSLDANQDKAIQLIMQLGQEAPELPILAVSGRNDGQAILQALRSGAWEFLTAPVQLEELLKALRRVQDLKGGQVQARGGPTAANNESIVCSVIGSAGGAGCTTLAVNLAATLAKASCRPAVVDLDIALGDADVILDIRGEYTLSDVALNIERIDMSFLNRSLCKHSCGVAVLPRPTRMDECHLIREEHLQRLISLLRASYSHVILDLTKGFSTNDITALQMSDVIYLVTQLDLSGLHNVVRMLTTLEENADLCERIQIVVNRTGLETGITLRQAKDLLANQNKKIQWEIPDDPRSVDEARTAGAPLIQCAPKSKMQQGMEKWAQSLIAVPSKSESAATPARKSGWLTSVLGR